MPKSAGGNSARQRFISMIERRILSGELKVDQQLPPERELAEQTGISRVTVHAGLVELASRGVLRVVPRQGTFVSDYKKEGTLELYSALLRYTGEMEADIFDSLIAFREIVETAAAELAAQRHSPQDVQALQSLLKLEREAASTQEAAALDFQIHLAVARASGNIILPMTLRSIEPMYMSLVARFYEALDDRAVVYDFHERLIAAVETGDGLEASIVMKALLDHGRSVMEARGRT